MEHEGDLARVTAESQSEHNFDVIYRTYSSWVRSLVLRQVRCHADADELTQEIFVRVYKALPRFEGDDVRPWLRTISHNACMDHHRRSKRVQLQTLPDDHEVATPADTELSDRLESVFAGLSPRHALLLYLRSEGWSLDDLAQLTGTTQPRMKALLHRARTTFRGQWSAA